VAPWLRAQVLGFLVKHSGNFQPRTKTSPWLRNSANAGYTSSAPQEALPGRPMEYRKSGIALQSVVGCIAKL